MKLFTRYNRINLLSTVIIFLMASFVFYFLLRRVLVRQVDEDLEIEQTEISTYVSRYQRLPEIVQQEDQKVTYVYGQPPVENSRFKTIAGQTGKEDTRQILFSLHLPEGWRNIIISKSLEGTDHLTRTVATTALAMILVTLAFTFLLNRIVLRRLWQPFYNSMAALQTFRLDNKEPLQFPATHIDEFQLMNATLQQSTEKASQDYLLLKEFTENASHELQTPLAVIRSKLELLIQEPLSETQGHAVQQASDAIKLLARMNRSLLLLAKIQNQQFAEKEQVDMKDLIEEKLEIFKELILSKEIVVEATLPELQLNMNADLASLLVSNVLSNAIKHNKRGGTIQLALSSKGLQMANTGTAQALDTSRLFTRFYNPSKAENSTGLGLSIVKQVCEASGFTTQYAFENGLHQFTILF